MHLSPPKSSDTDLLVHRLPRVEAEKSFGAVLGAEKHKTTPILAHLQPLVRKSDKRKGRPRQGIQVCLHAGKDKSFRHENRQFSKGGQLALRSLKFYVFLLPLLVNFGVFLCDEGLDKNVRFELAARNV